MITIKKKFINLIIILMIIAVPNNVFAYSKYIIPGGSTVGIEVNSDGVLVVGLYDTISNSNKDFKSGDRIIMINDKKVNNVDEMIEVINKDSNTTNDFSFVIDRNHERLTIYTKLIKDENGVIKTGLYVKDRINGIGTLTYIDPNTKIFGALGHEIIDKNTASKFEIKDGAIYHASVNSIVKSKENKAGEKNAQYDDTSIGTINKNTEAGIFGKIENIDDAERIEVSSIGDIHTGKAYIRTVINKEKVEEFSINIIKLDEDNDTKNILFEITDQDLITSTGGIVQGMSGSPILHPPTIIGAVTHVIMNDVTKGYGIFITKMLKKGEE